MASVATHANLPVIPYGAVVGAVELAAIQAAAAAILDLSCVVERKTLTPDGQGGSTEAWNPVAAVKVGMAQPTAGQLQNYDYLIGSLAAWQVKFPVGTDVRHQDHLIVGGQTLVVQVIMNPRSYAALLTVLASEVK
jgi:hypothetical protein